MGRIRPSTVDRKKTMATDEAIQGDEQAVTQASAEDLTAYDEVPYSSHPYSASHPSRLSVMGTLFGMQPANVEHCRVLELGCASGGNLIPMATVLPESEFIGIDLSSVQVSDGHKTIEALGVRNVDLRRMSIMDVDASLGEFDYIITHGVYSWVPEEVRRKILDICGERLKPQGIAYVSYNTYPGWHMRGTVRDMMLYHTARYEKPMEKAGHARALLDFICKAVPEDGGAYGTLLRREMDLMRNQADNYVLHDHLETVNHPVYFHEFARSAEESGLQFLSEADLGAMSLQGLAPDIRNIIKQLSRNLIECEQYVDFIRNRTFRRTLLCRRDVALNPRNMAQAIRKLFIASPAVPEGTIDIKSQEQSKFKVGGGTLASQVPIIKAAVSVLGERWPEAVAFETLLDESLRRMGYDPESVAAQRERAAGFLSENLIQCFAQRAIHFYTVPPPARRDPGERPRLFSVSRRQAQTTTRVTSLLHELVALTELDRQLALLCDGTRTQEDIVNRLMEDFRQGKLKASGAGNEPSQIEAALAKATRDSLARLARVALLEK
jgi:methyltransferase-like protein/2-polyprenyl-3-methyl-5-hydroxy-6-metoxy-1,4-benzoquinol methylase